MSQLVDILEPSALLGGGAVLCYLVIWWKRRNQQKARMIEAEGLQAKAQKEAENVLRDARLTANEEAMKLREQVEQALAAGRAEPEARPGSANRRAVHPDWGLQAWAQRAVLVRVGAQVQELPPGPACDRSPA